MSNLERSVPWRWLAAGVVAGLVFPAVGFALDPVAPAADGASLVDRVREQPLHGVIALAPLVLGAAGWAIGRDRQRLAALNRTLEDRVSARTAALEAASAETERVARARAAFLVDMSHEIRTPLNGVIGMTGLLLDTELGAEQRAFAETIRRSGDALLSLVNNVLDLSKIEAGRVDLEDVDFAPVEIVEEVCEMLSPRAHEKRVDLLVDVDPAVPARMRGDPGRLRQIVLNLGSNAVKFTEHGEIVFRVRRTDRGLLSVAVSDTGPGIPPERLAQLFHPYEQGDASTWRRFGGTGLGLVISRRIAERMGGDIAVESTVGKGSTFTVTLALAPPATPVAPAEQAPADIRGRAVLVVDDSPTNRQILQALLVAWGARPVLAENAAAALRALERSRSEGDPVSIALLDHALPDLDGYTLAQRIQEAPGPHPPLLLLSSEPRGGAPSPADAARFAARLRKPVRQSALFDGIVRALSDTTEEVAPPPPAPRAPSGARPRARVLLVEDNAVTQELGVRILERIGCRVDVAGTGREAIEALRRLPYDVVFMDCHMPDMDGYTATRAIRAEEREGRRIPIVAMTAEALDGERERCLDAGMDDYISKPARREDVYRKLDRWAPPPPVEVVIDRVRLADSTGGDPVFEAELWGIFLGDADRAVGDLERGLAAGDAQAVTRAAHLLKGSAAVMGVGAVVRAAHECEARARDGQLARVPGLPEELRMLLARLREMVSLTPPGKATTEAA